MILNVNPIKIRLWGKNPRYTEYNFVNFSEIGKEDYIKNAFDEYEDIYQKNLSKYYQNLVKVKRSKEKMLELIESISQGYNPNIDEILITSSQWLNKNKLYDINNKKIFYVLEGNRRIMAIHLLLNFNGAREILKNFLKDNEYNKFNLIFKEFDKSNINLSEIEVKFFDITNLTDDDIWKTLNIRHFGERKGKENWPRGMVLKSIYDKISNIRLNLGLSENEEMNDNDLKSTKKVIENFTGKTIRNIDLKSSLLTNYAINLYNNKYVNDPIILNLTNEEGEEKLDENIDIDSNFKEISYSSKETFSISSLELSMNTIKIIDKTGVYKSLSNIINLNVDIKKWTIFSNLDKNVLNELFIYIVNLVKEDLLNTRKVDQNYLEEIKAIIYIQNANEVKKVISSDIKKIKYENIPLSLLMEKESDILNKIEFSIDSKEAEEQKKNILSIRNDFIPILDIILDKENKARIRINNEQNIFIYSIINLWEIELSTIIRNKISLKISDLPLITMSAALRITGELIFTWILVKYCSDNTFYTDIISEINNNSFSKMNQNKQPRFITHINAEHTDWNDFLESIEKSKCYKCSAKDIYGILFIEKMVNNDTIHDQKEYIKKILNDIDLLNNPKFSDLIDNLNNFLKWIYNLNYYGGFSDKVNQLIHGPHYIKTIHNNSDMKTDYIKQLSLNINIILDFIGYILN